MEKARPQKSQRCCSSTALTFTSLNTSVPSSTDLGCDAPFNRINLGSGWGEDSRKRAQEIQPLLVDRIERAVSVADRVHHPT